MMILCLRARRGFVGFDESSDESPWTEADGDTSPDETPFAAVDEDEDNVAGSGSCRCLSSRARSRLMIRAPRARD